MEPANLSTHLTKRVADHASLPSRPNPRPNTPPAQLDPTNGSANPPMRRPDRLIRPRYCGERLGPTTTRLHHTDSPGGSAAQRTRGYLVDDSERHEAAESRGRPGTKAPATRTSSHTTTRSNGRAGALHPLRDRAPDQGHCTRSEEVHCLRIGCSTPIHKNKRGTGKPSHSPATTSPSTGRQADTGRALGGFVAPSTHTVPEHAKNPGLVPRG